MRTVFTVGYGLTIVRPWSRDFPDSKYQQFLVRIFVFFLDSSRKVLRQYPTISDDGVLPHPSYFIFYKNFSIQIYGPKTSAVQKTLLNYDTGTFL
jgi:hypothetical protein